MSYIDESRLVQVAAVIGSTPDFVPYNFASGIYPIPRRKDRRFQLNFFFLWALLSWGFWHLEGFKYRGPLYGVVDQKELKGSTLLTALLYKRYRKDIAFFYLSRLACVSRKEFAGIFTDDSGEPVKLLVTEKRYQMVIRMCKWFMKRDYFPIDLMKEANKSDQPLEEFRRIVGRIPGFDKDHMEKRQLLLAAALHNRPEKFLEFAPGEKLPPIVDYHQMRLVLRMGIVVPNKLERYFLEKRLQMPVFLDSSIRLATYQVLNQLVELSGREMSAVDRALWNGRKYCPEMEEPGCGECVFLDSCAREISLFQPVYKTDFF